MLLNVLRAVPFLVFLILLTTSSASGQWLQNPIDIDQTRTFRATYAADLDGDGDVDVVASSRSITDLDQNDLVWYENLGNSLFSAPRPINLGDPSRTTLITTANVDGVGADELITGKGDSGTPTVTVYQLNSDDTYSILTEFVAPRMFNSLVAGDLSGTTSQKLY